MSNIPVCPTCNGKGQIFLDVVLDPEEGQEEGQQARTMRTCPDCNGEGIPPGVKREWEE